jgi:hypothetical protein
MKRKPVENNKIPGVSYALTMDGIELPVLDITNQHFISSINEEKLERMILEIAPEARKRAESFKKIPLFIKRYLSKRSYIMSGMLEMESGNDYVSGLSTMMMKLGPGLIGKGRGKFLDRLGSGAVGAVMVRMRTRDVSSFLASSIAKSLKAFSGKDLCLVNIGGGTSTDSLNALILVSKTEPELISGIKIELNILDVDEYGPYFAIMSAKELISERGVLKGINLSCRHISYNWKDVSVLEDLLMNRKEWVTLFSSEGGLFEYGEEEDIIKNLRVISRIVKNKPVFSGSVIKDTLNVDPIFSETLDMMTIKPKQYGLEGLKRIADKTGWKFSDISDKNPRYSVFSMTSDSVV